MTVRRWQLVGALIALAGIVAVIGIVLASPQGSSPRPASGRQPLAPPAAPPAAPSPNAEQFGANVGGLFQRPPSAPRPDIAAGLEALRSSGGTVARQDALWEATESQPPTGGLHHYNWGFDDAIASALAAHGLRWLATLDYAPGWADASPPQGQVHPPPASASDYAAYCAAFADRYGPDGSFWRAHPQLQPVPVDTIEIWNEPDNPTFWYPSPNLAQYAVLYAAAARAIAAVKPQIRVIVGGLNHAPTTLRTLIPAIRALHAPIYGVSIHPYAPAPAGVLENVRRARRLLDTLGVGPVPLYVTEFGWTTQPQGALDYAPAQARPRYVHDTLAALGHTDCHIAAVTVFTWVTLELNPRSYVDWFGLVPPSGGPSPDRTAFAAGLDAAVTPQRTLPLCAAPTRVSRAADHPQSRARAGTRRGPLIADSG